MSRVKQGFIITFMVIAISLLIAFNILWYSDQNLMASVAPLLVDTVLDNVRIDNEIVYDVLFFLFIPIPTYPLVFLLIKLLNDTRTLLLQVIGFKTKREDTKEVETEEVQTCRYKLVPIPTRTEEVQKKPRRQ